jgi:hypothetical protein
VTDPLDLPADDEDLDNAFGMILGVHRMAPDLRHTLCGFDLIPGGKLSVSREFLRVDRNSCPACLDVLGAIG